MKYRALVVISVIAALLAVSCKKTPAPFRNVTVGDPLPPFSVVMSDGSVVTDGSLKGGPSVLVFFSPGCPDCKWQFDELQAFVEEYPSMCRIVAVSRGLAGLVPGYMEENGYTFPWSAQEDRSLYERFSDRGVPSMYVSDADGIVRFVHYDDSMAGREMLADEVSSIKNGR